MVYQLKINKGAKTTAERYSRVEKVITSLLRSLDIDKVDIHTFYLEERGQFKNFPRIGKATAMEEGFVMRHVPSL